MSRMWFEGSVTAEDEKSQLVLEYGVRAWDLFFFGVWYQFSMRAPQESGCRQDGPCSLSAGGSRTFGSRSSAFV